MMSVRPLARKMCRWHIGVRETYGVTHPYRGRRLWVQRMNLACLISTIAALAGPMALGLNSEKPPSPQRIIVIGPSVAEVLCGLGVGPRIVGVDKFCVYPPELADRPRVGGLFDPALETIVSLNPDLIVIRGRNLSIEQLCKERRIDIHIDRTDTLADIEVSIMSLAGRVDRIEAGQRMAAEFRRRIEALRSTAPSGSRPRVLLTVSRRLDGLVDILTTGKGTFLDEMLAIAGGTNVFGHLDMAWPQVSAESILVQRPEAIIELLPEVNMTEELRQRLIGQWSRFANIPAVSERRIYFVTDAHALTPSPRCVEIIEKFAHYLSDNKPKTDPRKE